MVEKINTVKTVNKKIDFISNLKLKSRVNKKNKPKVTVLTVILYIILGTIFPNVTFSQSNKLSNHTNQNINCSTCHTCDVPTKQNPCLVPCPRESMVTVHQPAEKGPDVIKIDKLEDKYMPVTFSHKVHAQMSEMSGGCAGCHHFNTAGPILPCESCHSKERNREDLSKPDLQAAYHRQCINCHKEWSHSTDCVSCHALKGSDLALQRTTEKGKDHPKVEEPSKLVYETNYNKGKLVTFFHNEHVNLFKTECVSCHQKESCTRCHDQSNVKPVSTGLPIRISKSGAERHQPCFKCHENDPCSKCHMDQEMEPFNHKISTGFALNKFHIDLECSQCHVNNKFTELNSSCTSCHNNFVAGSFNHDVTGLKLDEIHSELDCGDCHIDNNFAVKPGCDNCHDDKSYPEDKPGSLIKITKK